MKTMKRLIYPLVVVLLLFVASCAKSESADKIKQEIRKEIKAEIVNGETTVTITTTEDGKTKTEVLTGSDAEAYMAEDKLSDLEAPVGAEVIIKKLDHMDLDLNVDDIMNDPELQNLDEDIKVKVKAALENAMADAKIEMDFDIDEQTNSKVKTKVIVIDEEK